MTATTVPARIANAPSGVVKRTRIQWAFADGLAVTWRNLIALTRIPDALFFSSVQPVMFILLFRYVFGGAIPVPGLRYVDYLMPGIFMQTVAFGAIGTAIGLADDLQKGIIERFRSLPMARSAVLVGRTAADMVRNVFVFGLMTAVGFAVGFRVHTGVLSYIAAGGVLLMFAFSLSWGFAIIGLSAPNSETAQLMAFPILLPLSFASSSFVPIGTMPGWLQVFARNQPATAVVDAVRALCLGNVSAATPVLKSVMWSVGILVVLAPLAVRKYRRTV